MIRTCIYRGSYNPLHNGHILLAKHILDNDYADEVWFVVSPLNPFKEHDNDLLEENLRLELTRKALEGSCNMVASDYEFKLPRPSYMVRTLESLRNDFPQREFSLLIGADNWTSFHHWYHYEEILRHHHVYVYPREGYPIDDKILPDNVTLLATPLIRLSSTDIRSKIKNGDDIDHLVPAIIKETLVKIYK